MIKKDGNKKRKEFFSLLENKLIDFGGAILKKGVSNFALSQIDNTEEKIKKEIEEKYKKYQIKIFKTIFGAIAFSFIFYGALSLILFKTNYSEYTNIIFGIIFFIGYIFLSIKKNN